MADLLLFIGLCLVFFSIWQYKKRGKDETEDLQHMHEQILRAKEDVNLLIKELSGISEKVVDTISEKIKLAQETAEKLELSPPGNSTTQENRTLQENSTPQENRTPQENSTLQENKPSSRKTVKDTKVIRLLDNRPKEKETTREPAKKSRTNNFINLSSKHQAVYSLSDMGYSAEEIARKLAIGKGEVALILDLKFKGEEVNGL